MKIIDTPCRYVQPSRTERVQCVVIHATGETDLDKLLSYYTGNDEHVSPHYMVQTTGSVRRFHEGARIAYHAGIKPAEARLYQLGYGEWSQWHWVDGAPKHLGQEFTGYRTWRQTWYDRGCQSPLDLAGNSHPNAVSIGIELQSPEFQTKHIFEDEQYEALAALLVEVCHCHGVPLDREHLLGHYDVSPMRRSTEHGSYDPGERFDWLRLWDLVR